MQEDVYRGDGLNLYAYCANNPVMYYDPSGYWILCLNGKLEPTNNDFDKIRNYRNKVISEIDPKYLADPEYIIDMPFVGKGMDNANSQGWLRDSKHLIAQGNLPQVDDQFLKYFPQYKDYMFELLLHHHIGGSGQVMPISESLHSGSGGIHNIEKLNGIWGGIDMVNANRLQGIKSLTRRTRLWKNVRKK